MDSVKTRTRQRILEILIETQTAARTSKLGHRPPRTQGPMGETAWNAATACSYGQRRAQGTNSKETLKCMVQRCEPRGSRVLREPETVCVCKTHSPSLQIPTPSSLNPVPLTLQLAECTTSVAPITPFWEEIELIAIYPGASMRPQGTVIFPILKKGKLSQRENR